ncbi:MAG: hypothetical protein QOH04_1539 [Sphingomonadales bacterium]|jgi:hypothetical protein|nr:hypothetical protein [Sphingomonadales bacterium]
MKILLAAVPALLLAGCAAATDRPAAVSEKPVPFAVPVDAGCIGAKGRPARPQPLNQRYMAEQWAALAPGAKAAAGTAQAGAHMNYEDEDAAATAGCK